MASQREARFKALAGILAASERAGSPGAESLSDSAGGVPKDPDAVLARVGDNASKPPPASAETEAASGSAGYGSGPSLPDDGDVGDGGADAAARAAALERLLHFGKAALAKVGKGDFDLSRDEGCAMEALIVVDGSRPSFILRDGRYDPSDPFLGEWAAPLAGAGDRMAEVAKSVGRIQPADGNALSYIGSGTLVDRDKSLVLTNFHVVDQARTIHKVKMHRDGERLLVDGTLEIDFAGESGSLATNRYRIVEIRLPTGAGAVFAGVDAAVCRIDPTPLDEGGELPAAVKPVSDNPDYAMGASSSLALVGFPGPPAMDRGDKVDWDFVVRTLFRNRFGIKRLSPGRFKHGLGSNPADSAKRAIGHDATTFGGASGSLVCAWLDVDAPAFALHFAGQTVESNYALAFAKTRALLEPLGVPFG